MARVNEGQAERSAADTEASWLQCLSGTSLQTERTSAGHMASPAFSAAATACRAAACSASLAPRPLAVYVASGSSTSSLPGFLSSGTVRLQGNRVGREGALVEIWQQRFARHAWHCYGQAPCFLTWQADRACSRSTASTPQLPLVPPSSPPARELDWVAGWGASQARCAVSGGGVMPIQQLLQGAAAVDVGCRGPNWRRACGANAAGRTQDISPGSIWSSLTLPHGKRRHGCSMAAGVASVAGCRYPCALPGRGWAATGWSRMVGGA